MATGKYRKLPSKQELRFLKPEQKPFGDIRRSCGQCEYYHSDWRFRTCFYVECPYVRGKFTVRNVPLESDPDYMKKNEGAKLNGE